MELTAVYTEWKFVYRVPRSLCGPWATERQPGLADLQKQARLGLFPLGYLQVSGKATRPSSRCTSHQRQWVRFPSQSEQSCLKKTSLYEKEML